MSEKKLLLKLLVNSKKNKVIFAEVDSETADVIFGFLTPPLGTIIRQLNKHCSAETKALGCLNNLYASVSDLRSSCFWTNDRKLILLNPRNGYENEFEKLKLKIDDSEPMKYYGCQNSGPLKPSMSYQCTLGEVSVNYNKCSCGKPMSVTCEVSKLCKSKSDVFTRARQAFIITDDLCVIHSSVMSNFEAVKNLAEGVDVPKVHTVSVGIEEIMHLFKFSLISRTTLTSFLDHQLKLSYTVIELDNGGLLLNCQTADKLLVAKMVVKALLHKSTNELLLFVAGIDFVEFLFILLTIPLGKVVSLLNGKSNLGSIDNLHKSVNICNCKSGFVIEQLINAQLPEHYLSKKHTQILPLSKKTNPTGLLLKNSDGERGYVKGPELFRVTDDLKVTPLSSISIIEYLSSLNLHLSDVKEVVFEIGSQEALDILRASLPSRNSALSSALKFPSMKQPKKEK